MSHLSWAILSQVYVCSNCPLLPLISPHRIFPRNDYTFTEDLSSVSHKSQSLCSARQQKQKNKRGPLLGSVSEESGKLSIPLGRNKLQSSALPLCIPVDLSTYQRSLFSNMIQPISLKQRNALRRQCYNGTKNVFL